MNEMLRLLDSMGSEANMNIEDQIFDSKLTSEQQDAVLKKDIKAIENFLGARSESSCFVLVPEQ